MDDCRECFCEVTHNLSDFADEPYVHMSILKEDFERINSTDCEGGERPCLVL